MDSPSTSPSPAAPDRFTTTQSPNTADQRIELQKWSYRIMIGASIVTALLLVLYKILGMARGETATVFAWLMVIGIIGALAFTVAVLVASTFLSLILAIRALVRAKQQHKSVKGLDLGMLLVSVILIVGYTILGTTLIQRNNSAKQQNSKQASSQLIAGFGARSLYVPTDNSRFTVDSVNGHKSSDNSTVLKVTATDTNKHITIFYSATIGGKVPLVTNPQASSACPLVRRYSTPSVAKTCVVLSKQSNGSLIWYKQPMDSSGKEFEYFAQNGDIYYLIRLNNQANDHNLEADETVSTFLEALQTTSARQLYE